MPSFSDCVLLSSQHYEFAVSCSTKTDELSQQPFTNDTAKTDRRPRNQTDKFQKTRTEWSLQQIETTSSQPPILDCCSDVLRIEGRRPAVDPRWNSALRQEKPSPIAAVPNLNRPWLCSPIAVVPAASTHRSRDISCKE